MTTPGWIIMALSVGTVTVPLGWCIAKVLTTPEETDKVHGFDPDTPDQE